MIFSRRAGAERVMIFFSQGRPGPERVMIFFAGLAPAEGRVERHQFVVKSLVLFQCFLRPERHN